MKYQFRRNLAVFDIESAVRGQNPDAYLDKIVHLGIVLVDPAGQVLRRELLKFNPGIVMSEENVAIHGITNEMAATYPTMTAAHGRQILGMLADCDLAGFNLLRYDIPLLWEELNALDLEWDRKDVLVFDACNIFRKKEPRDLSAAVEFYTVKKHEGAHSAMADAEATLNVLVGQLTRYADLQLLKPDELADFSHMDGKFLDVHGKIRLNDEGEAVYNFGQQRGRRVVDDPGFGQWMLNKDFSVSTKRAVESVLYPPDPNQDTLGI